MGIETGKGELGDHLQKTILTCKKVGEDNQIEHFKIIFFLKSDGGKRDSPVSSSDSYM